MPRATRKTSAAKVTPRAKRARRPNPLIALWLDSDVIDHYQARGPGWQARINATLRKAAGI